MNLRILSSLAALICSAAAVLHPVARLDAAEPKPQKVTPRHDPPDMPFRGAPTPAAARSIHIPVSTNLHVGYDTELCRIHTVWRGRGLNLFGPQYSFAKSPFISTFDGEVLWTMPPLFPWAVGKIPAEDLPKLPAGLTPRNEMGMTGGEPTFTYLVGGEAFFRTGSEMYRVERLGDLVLLVRRFEMFAQARSNLFFLAHAEEGNTLIVPDRPQAVIIKRKTDTLLVVARGAVSWRIDSRNVDYTVERFTEIGAEKGNPRDVVRRRENRLWLEIPPTGAASADSSFEVVTTVCPSETKALDALKSGFNFQLQEGGVTKARLSACSTAPKAKIFPPSLATRPSVAGNEFYRVENFPVPKEIELLVTGMDFLTDGNLAIATWLGDIFVVDGATGPVSRARYRRVARGLLEPMGLLVLDGDKATSENRAGRIDATKPKETLTTRYDLIYVAQKSELTALLLADDGSEVCAFARGSADWDYSGHYNAFVYGPAALKDGNLAVAIAGHAGRWDLNHMGWVLHTGSSRNPSGRLAFASGLREPNGIGTFGPDRDLFVTDNQGNWIAACKLNHIVQGRFYGHPSAKPAPEAEYGKTTKFDPPAIWFPYKLVRSASGFVEIPDDRFGPFKGQMLVGDFQNALVTRVFLEKVNGEYQGAVWPMLKGFLSGVNRLAFGPDGCLYVGGCQRTWAAVAPIEAALERVSFTGKIPFEVREARAQSDGFELAFTKPVDPATAGNPESYDVGQYNYRYTSKYGSPELDHEGRENRSTAINVTRAEVSADKLKVRLHLQGWKPGYVTSVRSADVRSATGESLWNNTFYYTLNQIPK